LVSIFITSYNDFHYLNKVLGDLDRQDFGNFEILVLEAGLNQEQEARQALKKRAPALKYFHQPGASRTYSLNQLIKHASGDLLIRIDARTHIKPDYVRKIAELSEKTGAANVGGIMWPVGESEDQCVIAELMRSPWVFGGGRFRRPGFKGEAETVYLGAFRKKDIPVSEWYDEKHSKISEDSDLNYRLRKLGKNVLIDSSIVAYHYPRENLTKFFTLCLNYGIGRGLFVIKHKSLLASRQLLFVAGALSFACLMVAGILSPSFLGAAVILGIIYVGIVFILGLRQKTSLKYKLKFILGVMGAHLCWLSGLFLSPIQYWRDVRIRKITPT